MEGFLLVLSASAHVLAYILFLKHSSTLFLALLLLLSLQPRCQFLQGAFPDPQIKLSYFIATYIALIMKLTVFLYLCLSLFPIRQ